MRLNITENRPMIEEMMKKHEHPVGRPSEKRLYDETVIAPTIEDQGIGKTQLTRWQKVG